MLKFCMYHGLLGVIPKIHRIMCSYEHDVSELYVIILMTNCDVIVLICDITICCSDLCLISIVTHNP